MKNPIGVPTKKKIILIIKGETMFPKRIPNLNQIKFNGIKIFEFIIPKIKKIIDRINDHNLGLLSFKIG